MSENWYKENEEDLKKIGIKEYDYKDILLFNSYHTDGSQVVSNFNGDCEIRINGRVYNSVEKLYHCIVYGDSVSLCDRIYRCNSAREIKKIVNGYNREIPVIEDMRILRLCIRLKYLYNKKFRDYFHKHIDKVYVEDEKWSDENLWGAKYDSSIKKYRGYNITGRLYNELKKGVDLDDLYIDDKWLLFNEKIDRKTIGVGYTEEHHIPIVIDKDELMNIIGEGL